MTDESYNYLMLRAIKQRYGSLTDYANIIQVPISTVARWVNGDTWPRSKVRQQVIFDTLGIRTTKYGKAARRPLRKIEKSA